MSLYTKPIIRFSIGICRLGRGSHHPWRIPTDGPQVEKSVNFTFFQQKLFLMSRYGGHQFGHWASQLGDGRAHLLGGQIIVSIFLDLDPDSGMSSHSTTLSNSSLFWNCLRSRSSSICAQGSSPTAWASAGSCSWREVDVPHTPGGDDDSHGRWKWRW